MDWLLSGVRDAGIRLPDPFALTLGNVLDLVLQVLAITKEKVLQRIDALMGPKVGKRVRQVLAAGGKVLAWLHTLVTEGPAGLWRHLRADLSNLWDKLLGFVIDYLVGKLVQQATIWIAKTLASSRFSVIVDAIKAVYDALQVIAQYLRQLLEVVNSVCSGVIDIAKGVIARAADLVEDAASRLVPVMLAFLARTLGIGDLPVVIGEGIQRIRQTVENAIDALIKRTIKAVDWLKEQGRAALERRARVVAAAAGLHERRRRTAHAVVPGRRVRRSADGRVDATSARHLPRRLRNRQATRRHGEGSHSADSHQGHKDREPQEPSRHSAIAAASTPRTASRSANSSPRSPSYSAGCARRRQATRDRRVMERARGGRREHAGRTVIAEPGTVRGQPAGGGIKTLAADERALPPENTSAVTC